MYKKKFSYFLLGISLVLLINIIYKSEIYYSGNQREYYLKFLFIFFLFVVISLLSIFLKKIFTTYLKIILISVIFVIYSFQTYLTFKYSGSAGYISKKISIYEKQNGKKYDTRTRYEFYNYLKKNDKNVVVTMAPSYNLEYLGKQYLPNKIFPLAGISKQKTVNCNENGYFSTYQSDRYGFNNPDTEWNEKAFEYVMVGDSFTHGNCVNRPHDIASALRTISKKNALNLGYAGNGPLFQYATLREYLKRNVRNIIWVYSENDVSDLNRDLKSKVLNQYLNDNKFSQNLIFKQDKIDKSLKQLSKEFEKKESKKRLIDKKEKNSLIYKINKFITLKNVRELFLQKFITFHDIEYSINPKFEEVLKKANKIANDNNSKFYFVFMPAFERYAENFDKDEIQYNQIKELVEGLNITFIDMHKDFLKQSNKLEFFPFQSWGHYNIDGYKRVAEIIYKITSKN